MQVLLIKDDVNLGKAGENVKVKPGYARNYLIPQNRAVLATTSNLRKYEGFIKKMEKIRVTEVKAAGEVKNRIEALTLKFLEKASAEGRLFGSVGVSQIAAKLKEEGITVEKQQIILPAHIKEAGAYEARVRLYHGVEAKIQIVVETEKEEAPPEELTLKPEPAAAEAAPAETAVAEPAETKP